MWIVAQFILNCSHLLMKEVIALLFVQVLAHTVLNFVAHFEHLHFECQMFHDHHHAFFDIHFLQHFLLLGNICVHV